MHAAGIRQYGGTVEPLELADPEPEAGQVVLSVMAAGVGNWDELVRIGDWEVGRRPPMALGVEAAGVVTTAGEQVDRFQAGDEVMCHPVPLPYQGAWAERLVAPAASLAFKPSVVPWNVAGAFPVPALTAMQALSEAVGVKGGETVLVHGAAGVTGGLIVQLAAYRGARVVATAGPGSADRLGRLGAEHVFDSHASDWVDRVVQATSGGVPAAVNAARGGAASALRAVAAGGRLATITSDPPKPEREVSVADVYVRSDGDQLRDLAALLGEGHLSLTVADSVTLSEVGAGLVRVGRGSVHGALVVVQG
jgi:NADPH:quinone reductase-like Zn-dependent oxidoreductase